MSFSTDSEAFRERELNVSGSRQKPSCKTASQELRPQALSPIPYSSSAIPESHLLPDCQNFQMPKAKALQGTQELLGTKSARMNRNP